MLSSTGQSQNFTGHLSVEYTTSASLLQAVYWRMFSWLWGTVDFDSKYNILRGETRAHGVYLFMKKKKKVKTRFYIIILKFPSPIISD